MTLYVLIHIYHGGLIDGGVRLRMSTNRSDMEDEMYHQLGKTLSMMDQDRHYAEFNGEVGYAFIRHESFDGQVYDHEWRIVVL